MARKNTSSRAFDLLLAKAEKIQGLQIQPLRFEVGFRNLPEPFHGFTILHLSDLHIDFREKVVDDIIDACKGKKCDILVFGGDIMDNKNANTRWIAEKVAKILENVQYEKSYAILGNHDHPKLGEELSRTGITMLDNKIERLSIENERIMIGGLADTSQGVGDEVFQTARAIQRKDVGFKIVVTHSPCAAELVRDCDLFIAGHTHGGQICWPNGQQIIRPKGHNYPKERSRGIWKLGRMVGITNPGAGVTKIPLRLFSKGAVCEVALLRQ